MKLPQAITVPHRLLILQRVLRICPADNERGDIQKVKQLYDICCASPAQLRVLWASIFLRLPNASRLLLSTLRLPVTHLSFVAICSHNVHGNHTVPLPRHPRIPFWVFRFSTSFFHHKHFISRTPSLRGHWSTPAVLNRKGVSAAEFFISTLWTTTNFSSESQRRQKGEPSRCVRQLEVPFTCVEVHSNCKVSHFQVNSY